MKRLLTILLVLLGLGSMAQTYDNEWIDYSKTYYKFKIIADGLYRIPQSTLAAAGLASVPATQFQLYRNGVEIPLYTSVPNGTLGTGDYIEFWGEKNDGKPDKPLYRNPIFQHTDKTSLETDTATYFLTVNPAGAARYQNTTNDVADNTLPEEPYFMYTQGTYYRDMINPGAAYLLDQYIYSSSYDSGELWSSNYVTPSTPLSETLTSLPIYSSGPAATFRFGAAGSADTLRHVQARVNNVLVKDTSLNSFRDLVTTASIPVNGLNAGSTTIAFANASQATTFSDRLVISFYELTYPRLFNFGGVANFPFTLPARAGGYFLRITNFNAGSATAVLYDRSNGQRFTPVMAGGTFQFALPGTSVDRNLVLVSEDASNVQTVPRLTTKTFINYANTSLQGNYLIISHPVLYTGSSGNNPVTDYKSYRNSAAGGSYTAQVYDVNELVDQFAFGINKHPLAVKNFLNYARNTFSVKPQQALIIGRGISYDEYYGVQGTPQAEALNLVPTFGFPASDVMLATEDGAHHVAKIPIGRLGAVSGKEVETYLSKVKEYEQAQQNGINTEAARSWRKTVVQVTGATDPFLESILCSYMHGFQSIIQDTLFGANVYTYCGTTVDQNNQLSSQEFPALFSNGIGILNYFGHSAASELGFNLDDPTLYTNQGKYPVFYVNGCYAGNYYTYDVGRLSLPNTLSETYTFTKSKGSIAFIASTHYGVVSYLAPLLNHLYNLITLGDYGKSIGQLQADAAQQLLNQLPNDFTARCHAEEINIQGDPAITINEQKLPDYDIESSMVKVDPNFVSVADNSFTLSATMLNLGKAVGDSITVLVTRKYPDGSTAQVLRKRIPAIRYGDSLTLSVPIVASRDKGQNYLTITVNADNDVTEVTRANNSVTVPVFVYQDEITPIYPYDYAIINNNTQKLYASTANPFAATSQYVLEIDTTTAFNSPAKVSKTVTSVGGAIEFDPGFSYRDSVVYYWRTSIVPAQGGTYHWNMFSFTYIDSAHSGPGFNQSHYFQHLGSTGDGMSLAANRQWVYGTHPGNLYITQAMYPTSGTVDGDFNVRVNGGPLNLSSACVGYSLIFQVFDAASFQPWKNVDANGNNLYRYGSGSANCKPSRNWNFEFQYLTSAERKKIMDFMDTIPNGSYVVIRSSDYDDPNSYASTWRGDTTLYGHNNSLYHKLLAAGFTEIDSINSPRDWVLVYHKGDAGFTPAFKFSQGIYDKIILSVDLNLLNLTASMSSPVFGPAKAWKQVHWRGSSLETPSTDSFGVEVIGVDTSGNHTPLYALASTTQDFDISAVNAKQFPYVQLMLTTTDSVHATPWQLKYWRLNYLPVPEGALAPNIFLTVKDSVELGEKIDFGIAFKNVSPTAFDSLKLTLNIIDKNNVTHVIALPKKKPLVSGDTVKITYEIDTKDLPGLNTIFLDVNPNNDQPEQYHFNNFLYKSFYVKVDQTNPLLDVTFDNVHILNDDIVSARPHVLIKLKDEAKFLLLNDTSVIKVQLRYPDGSLHPYYFNSDTLRFTPATSSADNTATVDFSPVFSNQSDPNGDTYTLIVTGHDKSGNASGTISYQVSFKIITKPMISNMLNYPNPFTTSTAFVFTITGSEVPQNIKIQILTITGKVVREITKEELGPLHVGRNITEFKWDGTDMFHQRLGVGVYLYHVVTNLNGKSLDKYRSANDNTDQYFNKGYGKMFLMK